MANFDMEAVMEIEHGYGKGSKKPVDETAPKRPSSAYFLWANKMRPSVMKDNSDATLGEIAKILGKMWKKTSSSDRSSFENKAEKEKDTYRSKMEKYKNTSRYKKFQMEMLAWKIHETKKPYPKDQNAPKRNLSAYMLYGASVRSQITKENPDMAAPEILKETGAWWKALNAKDRKPWLEKAEAEKEKYQKKLTRYMKTSDYQSWASGRDEYKKEMLEKRNKLMGIKKRPRSDSKPGSAKKLKRSTRRSGSRTPKSSKKSSRSASRKSSRRRAARRSRTPKASKRRSTSRRASKRRARTPKAPRRSRRSKRSASRRSSRLSRAVRRSRTPKSISRSKSRKSKSRSSRRASKKTESPKKSARRRASRRTKAKKTAEANE